MLETTKHIKDGGYRRMNTTRQRGEEEESVDEEESAQEFYSVRSER